MHKIAIAIMCIILTGCCCNVNQEKETFCVLSYEFVQGEHMYDIFDRLEEPMHAKYIGNNKSRWTYFIDINDNCDCNKIVRYCELRKYGANSLCRMYLEFDGKLLTNAYTDC